MAPPDDSARQPVDAGGEPGHPYDLRMLRALRRIMRAVDLHSRKLKSEFGLTSPQLICLVTVAEGDRMTVSEIGRAVHLSNSTTVGILDRLERQGLVLRERSKRDRRLVHVSVTEAGRGVVAESPSPLQDRLADALANLPELEQATIALALERVVELMEARHLEAAPILDAASLDAPTCSGAEDPPGAAQV